MNTTTIAAARGRSGLARTVLGVFKLRIGMLIMVTALGGLAFARGPAPSLAQVIVLALAVLVASAAAGGFNQFVEADADRLMARTRRRAFVSGALSRSRWWLVVFAVLLAAAVGSAAAVVNPVAALFIFLGAFFYGVIYTLWLKRRTWVNIVIGGAAGSFAVLAGAAAVDPTLGPLPLLLAATLLLWTPPHFWSLAIASQAEYAAAGVPMLPVVVGPERAARTVHASAITLVVVSLLPALFGAGPAYTIGAAAGGAYFLRKTHALARAPGRATAMASFFASMVQLSVVLAAVAVDAVVR
jgi:protoheme IX farnesyltransferase